MKVSRTNFVIRILVFGFAYTTATRLILNQMPASLARSNYGSVSQASWQIAVSTILSPVKFVLMGPLLPLFNWMLSQQDADPPPPMLLVMFAFYWVILALVLHYFLSKIKHQQTADRHTGKSTST